MTGAAAAHENNPSAHKNMASMSFHVMGVIWVTLLCLRSFVAEAKMTGLMVLASALSSGITLHGSALRPEAQRELVVIDFGFFDHPCVLIHAKINKF